MKKEIEIRVNRRAYRIEVDPSETLLKVLRGKLGLTGTKDGCSAGDCGACTVLVDNAAYNSCILLAVRCQGKEIMTIEGLAGDGSLHPLQRAFIKYGGFQCGYCTPGILMSAKALLDENPNPTEFEIRKALAGNLCRCTGYKKVIQSVQAAAAEMGEEAGSA